MKRIMYVGSVFFLGCTDPISNTWIGSYVVINSPEGDNEEHTLPYTEDGVSIVQRLDLHIEPTLSGNMFIEGTYNNCEEECVIEVSVRNQGDGEYTITSTEDDTLSLECVFGIPNLYNPLDCTSQDMFVQFDLQP